MNILIVGSGGREHILAETYSKSKKVKKVFVAPGNDLMSWKNEKIRTTPRISTLDFENIIMLTKKERIDFVDVAQDDPLAAGLVDVLSVENIPTFGPFQTAAEIEWNKAWARNFMQRYELPIPRFMSFSNQREGIKYVEAQREQLWFIKAAGLAQGKGVIRADTKQEAKKAIEQMAKFGESGRTFVIEEGLVGEEFSFFAICDGKDYQLAGFAQDHKTVFNHNEGLNTGGMGCIAPTNALNKKLIQQIEITILKPFMKGMQKEGRSYEGILYMGGMITKNGIKIIEFNARWGDPEAEVILPSIQTDYITIVEAVKAKKIKNLLLQYDKKVRISIAACSRGYPEDYSLVKGKEIFGLQDAVKIPGAHIYGSGIKRINNRFFVNGGRIFHLVAEGKTVQEARRNAYGAMSFIFIEGNNLHYRTDIGYRDVERLYK